MREIKFRAWYVTDGRMITVNDEGGYAKVKSLSELFRMAEINTYEVMQFTGLIDKNGKEIYEGDIVTLWNGLYDLKEHYVVRWYQFGFDYSNPANSNETHYFPQDKIEVIGNIWENGDLLK